MADSFTKSSLAPGLTLLSVLHLHYSRQKYSLQNEKFNQHRPSPTILEGCLDWFPYIATLVGLAGFAQEEPTSSDKNSGVNPPEEGQYSIPAYSTIQHFITQNTDIVLILAISHVQLIPLYKQQISEFTRLINNIRRSSDRYRFILIYNTGQNYDDKIGNPIYQETLTTPVSWPGNVFYKGLPVPDVMIFSSGQATCFRGSPEHCDRDLSYSKYWKNAFDITASGFKENRPRDGRSSEDIRIEILRGSYYFLTFPGPVLLHRYPQPNREWFQFDPETYPLANALKERTFLNSESLRTPVYRPTIPQTESSSYNRFEYAYHRRFNQGAALSRTLNTLSKKGYFQASDKVLLMTIGSTIMDSSMMTASMRYPFDQLTPGEDYGPQPLPPNVQFLFSILPDSGEEGKESPVAYLINEFPDFRPVRAPQRHISGIMKTLAEELQKEWSKRQ